MLKVEDPAEGERRGGGAREIALDVVDPVAVRAMGGPPGPPVRDCWRSFAIYTLCTHEYRMVGDCKGSILTGRPDTLGDAKVFNASVGI